MRGPQHIDEASQSDPVLIRADGSYLYTLTSVVDDIDFAISHVIRGDDHVTNTGAQIADLRGAGREACRPSAICRCCRCSGRGAVEAHRQPVARPAARARASSRWRSASYLAQLGTGDPVEPRLSLAELAADFDLATLRRRLAALRPGRAARISTPGCCIACPIARGRATACRRRRRRAALARRARQYRAPRRCRDLARGLPRRDRAGHRGCRTLPRRRRRLLPPEPWNETTWSAWTGRRQDRRPGARARRCSMPLRLALTGREHGPETEASATADRPRARAVARLRGPERAEAMRRSRLSQHADAPEAERSRRSIRRERAHVCLRPDGL